MPHLKCVGGPSDGRRAYVVDGWKDVRIPDPESKKAANYWHGDAQVSVTISTTVYTVRELRGPDDWRLRFLAPAEWPDFKAIEHQFAK